MQDDTFVKHKFLSTSTRENSVEITPITPLKTPSKIDLVKRFAFQGSNKIEKVLAANVTERDQVAPPFSLPEPFQNVLSPDKNHSKIYKSLSNDSKNLILHSESDLNLFELSIIQFFHCHDNKNFKLIYLASTLQNSLKKFQYWLGIFSDTGISFGLISADSFGNEVSILQSNQVIVTTAKTWCQFNVKRGSLSIELLIKGFLVDEIGALGDRCDSSLELVVTGMKVSCPSLRIITFAPFSKFSYVDDLSQWLGPVTILSIFQRGKQSMKPNLLVQAFPFKNIFQFDVSLNSRLIDFIIQKGNLQPTVIFCPTRNFACRTAKYLSKLNVPNNKSSDKKLISVGGELGECIRSGIAVFHHGGLSQRERKVVEVAFEKREVGIVCTVLNSETLNFNFPSAQLYILKSTIFYKGKDFKEFTNDQLNQFIERCHPKKCIVMTSEQTKLKFETPGVISKNSGGNCVESYLHYNFYSSLLTEIRSGRLKSFIECIAWLENTYLYFRFTNNPKLEHYALLECNDPYKGLLELLKLCIEELYKEELVTLKESDTITSTFYGETMIDNRLTLSTIRSIVRGELLQITGPSEFLLTVCKFQEFIKFRLKHNEKSFYKSINKSIRYEQTKSLETCNKVSIIIQYALSNIMSNNHEMGRIGAVFQNDVKFVKVEFIKICQILIDVFQYRRESVGLRYALSFLRNFQHGIWEDDFSVFSQFRELKPALIERFEKILFIHLILQRRLVK